MMSQYLGQLSTIVWLLAVANPCRATGQELPSEAIVEATISETPIDAIDRSHWSFRPIERPRLPNVIQTEWPATAVDRFILHELEKQGISPAPPAGPATLLRRLKFDLLGLPPTPTEVVEFERDASFKAYTMLVDQMLASPAYGERWAQFWLDLARFAETDGFEHDKVRKEAWRYRQWIIDAFNQDMPYNEFVQNQLVGDLIDDGSNAIATVFCMAGPDMPDINEQDLRRHDKMNELTSTVGAVLLGLQMHCAQCHDHKYDPISQADFYRLRGVFEAAVPELKRDRPVVQLTSQSQAIAPWIYFRGELGGRGPKVAPRPPRVACSANQGISFHDKDPRLAFADWLFTPENPLTARVIANRIWQQHFGKSICENPSDVGLIASAPTHPNLLDWLASEIRKNDWSIKQLHRVILLSSTYRQSSRPSPITESGSLRSQHEHARKKDPSNEFYSRFPRKRLEGEAIRDSLLQISGQLNLAYGGPSVMPPLPHELRSTLLKGQWKGSKNREDHVRRSIYVFARRNLRYPIFEVFDRPDAGTSCAQRDRSTTAIQSLQMLNSDLTFKSAERLCDRLLVEQSAPRGDMHIRQLVEQLFLTALSRQPTRTEAERFVKLLKSPESRLRENLLVACVAILNASEFVYID